MTVLHYTQQQLGAASTRRFEAVGEGEDLRITDASLSGGAPIYNNTLVHLCAFAEEAPCNTSSPGPLA